MRKENYIPHIELLFKCFESMLTDYPYVLNEGEDTALRGYLASVTKFYNEIKPYYNGKDITKVQLEIIERNMRKIFDIEELCKKFIIKIWNEVLTNTMTFNQGDPFDFLVYSFNFEVADFSKILEGMDQIVLNYITEKNFGLDNRNYGIIFKITEEDIVVSSSDSIFFDIQQKQDNIIMKTLKRNSLQKYMIDNKLLFHNNSSCIITPKILKQKIIEKEMKNKGTLLGLDNSREYTNTMVANSKTLTPDSFFLIDDKKQDYTEIIENLKVYADVYHMKVIILDKYDYANKLESVYKKNTI